MDLGLKGKVALITGGSRGIGRAIALGLAEEGCKVAICARGAEALEEAVRSIRERGADALAVPADITQEEDIQGFVDKATSAFGAVHILVNNAGGGGGGLQPTDEDWRRALDINLLAAIRSSRLVTPVMMQEGWGRIINIASIWGRESGGGPTYNAAKASLISFSKSLAMQLAPHGITVNSLCPGSILFPGGGWARRVEADPEGMAQFVKQNIAGGRFGRLEEVASVAVFLASEQASWITGAAINVDGGQSRSNI
ncbi:MAG: 3-oxoacyl-acyl carrier protein reductase [Dehalococcoidia bacterium]|nr:3-oxoacyl-acyl carrier protein reductase [Dehalococcoidia bacterium]